MQVKVLMLAVIIGSDAPRSIEGKLVAETNMSCHRQYKNPVITVATESHPLANK
jgi:hypothetical protein